MSVSSLLRLPVLLLFLVSFTNALAVNIKKPPLSSTNTSNNCGIACLISRNVAGDIGARVIEESAKFVAKQSLETSKSELSQTEQELAQAQQELQQAQQDAANCQ